MKRIVMIIALAGGVLLAGCSSLFSTSLVGTNDLYRVDNRVQVANQLKAEAEAQRAEAEAREAQWIARQAEAEADRAEAEYYASLNEPSYQSIVANDYESAYARRLYGFNSPSYRMPSSYYDLSYSRNLTYAMAYDPSLYNIMVSGNQVWVEPKFITSMFGSWGATNVTFGLYASPWNYGWSYRVDPFYYSSWGYPHYSWYDWNWTICYNPWYYDACYYHHYYPHYHNHYYPHYHGHVPPPRPPHHRPNDRPNHRPDNRPNHGYITTGSGASSGPISGNLNGGRGSEGSRYTSPHNNKNYGSATVTRPVNGNTRPTTGGSTSTGVNSDSKYCVTTTNIGSVAAKESTPVNRGSSTTVNTTTSVNKGTTTSGSTNSNFRQGGTTSRGTTTSSGSVSKGTSTSSSRSSGTVSSGSSSSKSSSSSYRSSSSSSSYRSSGSSSSSRSYSGSSSSSSSSRGGSTSSRR